MFKKEKSSTIIKMPSKCITCHIKQTSYNYKDEQKLLYCNDGKLENMVDVLNKMYHI